MSGDGNDVQDHVGTAAAGTTVGSEVASLAVYPPIGIARIGTDDVRTPDPWARCVFGPEVVGSGATLADGSPARLRDDFRHADGGVRRQAARFRVYATMRDGTKREVTAADKADIAWTVSLANLKAGWYQFLQAMDLPHGLARSAERRNAKTSLDRGRLDIVPTPRSIKGRGLSGPAYHLADGSFDGERVYLGELATDADGRLLILGGVGASAAMAGGGPPTTFANNDGWHDDVADGPVRATVTFADGTVLVADPGYVVVTPPSYAPGLVGLVTMDDTVRETFFANGWLPRPSTTTFKDDVWPIFDRLTGHQWVNHGLFVAHGEGSPLDARDPAVVAKLRDGSTTARSWRERVLELFRDPSNTGPFQEALIPQTYGDAYGESHTDPSVYLSVTPSQYAHLARWADGTFSDDWPGGPPTPPRFEDLTPDEQVRNLERAALHDCLGGPFHPGIELTWVMRLPGVWAGPYRLKVLPSDGPARQDYGDMLTPPVCVGPSGPFDGVAAGSLTRFLGVPWQTDSTSCNSAADYEPTTFLSMPTFWGARMPDQVLAEANYDRIAALATLALPTQAQKHFATRVDWLRDVRDRTYEKRLAHMIEEWWRLGMVLPVPSPPSGMPEATRVEQGRHPASAGDDPKRRLVAAIEGLAGPAPARAEGLRVDGATRPRRTFRQGEV